MIANCAFTPNDVAVLSAITELRQSAEQYDDDTVCTMSTLLPEMDGRQFYAVWNDCPREVGKAALRLPYPPPHTDEQYIVETVQQFRADVKNAIMDGHRSWSTVMNLDGHVFHLTWDIRISPPLGDK